MTVIVAYRLPEAQKYRLIRSTHEPLVIPSYASLSGLSGFVFAPFSVSTSAPLLVIPADDVQEYYCEKCKGETGTAGIEIVASDRDSYHEDFRRFRANLLSRRFQKIVLSRHIEVESKEDLDPMYLFNRACALYPHQFVCLVSTPRSGTWLMATPEVLIERKPGESLWHTMALAGTMRKAGAWEDKDCREQQYVADYIGRSLSVYAEETVKSEPYTRIAANLYHRCTDFHFSLKHDGEVGRVLSALHPTPAVCGIPKQAALEFILNNESHERKYYSGFCGPLNMDGATHLYVSLRCMEIMDNICRLYAGGGLLIDSEEKREWEETEIKLNTMLNVLR